MRSLVVGLFLSLGLVVNSAEAFVVNPHITITPGAINAVVVNQFAYPMRCSGNVFGLTASGATFNSYMYDVLVFPGQWAYGYVYSTFEPFVNGWANIHCYFSY